MYPTAVAGAMVRRRAQGFSGFGPSLPPASTLAGVILADQIKSLDWRVRRIHFASQAPSHVVGEVLEKLPRAGHVHAKTTPNASCGLLASMS